MRPNDRRRNPSAALAVAVAVAAALALPVGADAQERHGGHVHGEFQHLPDGPPRTPRWDVGAGLAVAVPQGVFGDYVGEGVGLQLHATYGLDPSNVVGLRFDVGFVNYGNERFTVPLLPTTGRVLVDLNTSNNIGFAGLGPQIQVPSGPIRPYVNGFVGLGYFFTESSVRGSSDFEFDTFARTVNFDDVSFAYGAGAGLGLRLKRSRHPVYLNIDAQYRRHGETEYLREGSILDDGFGGVLIEPLRSEADFMVVQLGLSVGL